ncbi:hypothetical protein NL676_006931 [Syzygium grande]|nr:hypothetical protein NL676_006931 [Syzygium grande]
MVSSSSSFERTLAVQLRSVGNGLLNTPSSVDELLALLNGLIAEALFKHSNEDVRITVASWFSEILRITALQQPYSEDQMKAIFQLIVDALSKLSQPSTRCYEKALSVLQNIAMVKACLVMLDLEYEALFPQMCQQFWVITRSNPSVDAYWAVEQIMADIFTFSEDISPDLILPLLASVLKENEKVAPSCRKLGEKLISDSAAKLTPILRGTLQPKGTTLDDYSPVVAFICRDKSATEYNHTNGSPKRGIADSGDSKGSILPRERESKASSLMRSKEDYNLSWLYRESQTTKQPQNRTISVSRSNFTAVPTVSSRKRKPAPKSNVESVRDEAAVVSSDLRDKRMKLPTKGGSNTKKGTLREFGVLAGVLVGRRIKVWWPLDEMFYDGLIQSYDPVMKKHKVLYDDKDEETLNLEKERWEFIEDDLLDEEAENPKPFTSPAILTKQSGSGKSSESMKISNHKENVKRAGEATRLPEVEAPKLSNQNIGGDESSDDESNDDKKAAHSDISGRNQRMSNYKAHLMTQLRKLARLDLGDSGGVDLRVTNLKVELQSMDNSYSSGKNNRSYKSKEGINMQERTIRPLCKDTEVEEVPDVQEKIKALDSGGWMIDFNNAISELLSPNVAPTHCDLAIPCSLILKYVSSNCGLWVLHDDGDTETLNLEKERWELIKDDLPAEHRQEADHPKPDPSPVMAEASSRFPEVEVSQFGNQNVGIDESNDDESTEDNVYEIRFRSKDVQLRLQSTSDDSTPEASPPTPWGQWRSRFQRH